MCSVDKVPLTTDSSRSINDGDTGDETAKEEVLIADSAWSVVEKAEWEGVGPGKQPARPKSDIKNANPVDGWATSSGPVEVAERPEFRNISDYTAVLQTLSHEEVFLTVIVKNTIMFVPSFAWLKRMHYLSNIEKD